MTNNVCNFKVYGLNKLVVKQKLEHYTQQQLVRLSFITDAADDTTIKIVFPPETNRSVRDAVFNDIYTVFGQNLYADSDVTIASQIVTICRLRRIKISVAESITGGAVANEFVAVEGASSVFVEGIVCYDNESKINRLNVPPDLIRNYGAVSREVCYEMAVGLLNTKLCDFCIATTGIAGPGGGTALKPVGLTYTAIGGKDAVHVHKGIYEGTRNEIRRKVTLDALFQMWQNVKYR